MIKFKDMFLETKLITNEWAFRNKSNPLAVLSPNWDVTSGSLFLTPGGGWSGIPDGDSPDSSSSNATGSAVFRMVSKKIINAPFKLSLIISNDGFYETPRTPRVDWDGLHVFCGYQDPDNLYAVTFNRRDNLAVIKKKVLGSYVTLATRSFPLSREALLHQNVEVTHVDNTISLSIDGVFILSAKDGTFNSGKVGLRADNCEFTLADFRVEDV